MENEQNSLARNFDLFIEEFLDKDIDFKMAVTTTDPYDKGRAVKGLSGLEISDARVDEGLFLDEFNSRVRVGVQGYGKEQGLRTSISFLNRYGNLFLREDAYLIIIYVSDEDDQSPNSLETIYNNLTSFKKQKSLLKVFSIVNQKGRSYSYYESSGDRYCNLSKKTGGLCSNIKDDFSQILKSFGKKIADLKNVFLLKKKPLKAEIKVHLEGIEVEQGWIFQKDVNAIKFNENSLPDEGERIDVIYRYKI